MSSCSGEYYVKNFPPYHYSTFVMTFQGFFGVFLLSGGITAYKAGLPAICTDKSRYDDDPGIAGRATVHFTQPLSEERTVLRLDKGIKI